MSEINLQVIIAYHGNIAGDAEKKPLQDAARHAAGASFCHDWQVAQDCSSRDIAEAEALSIDFQA
jgi:hypothetical protein